MLYIGLYHDIEIEIRIDYNNWLAQLRYWVSVHDKQRAIKLVQFSYESLMGFPEAHWDCLAQSNLEESLALLKDLVIYCAELPQRLPPEYQQGDSA